ncbi:MAG: polyphosphate kinase 1 [Burkholderiaceae bacterium]
MTAPQPSDGRYVNRELSLLAFNERVLFMAERPDVPLLERLRYLCIVSSNLDEIFEIRVSGMKAKIRQGSGDLLEADGYSPHGNHLAVSERAHALIDHQYRLLNESIMPALASEGIRLHLAVTFNEAQRKWAHQYFMKEVLPVLTPIGLDPSHPFPRTLNKSLNFIVELTGKDAFGRRGTVAVVQAPRILPRLIPVPPEVSGHPHGFMMLTSVVQDNVQELFPGMTVLGVHQFRVTRNSDLFVDDEEITDLRETLRGELSQRQFGDAVRIEVSEATPDHLLDLLKREYGLETMDCYRVNGPVNLVRLMSLPDLIHRPDLKFPAFMASYPKRLANENPFVEIAKGDVLVHHPYESFNAVTDFLQAAARDPAVVAINMTVYRTGQTSELMDSLILAAKSGKAVTVVVELMARFDEETNINWASKLEQVGAHVVFGVVGNKTHAKACLVVRREKTGLRRYAHLGTGNYHPGKAKLYEDFGLFTADPQICADVHEIFHQLTGLGQNKPTRKVWHSPFTLHANVMKAISQEMRLAKQGKRAHIMAKMNSLVELEVIEKLYAASQAGVKVDLIIRGICMLRPGIPGLSENIQVRSTIGRFLEHSRIFYFRHDGDEQVYLSSADWMDRNFFRRVELAVPVLNPTLKKRVIREGLRMHLTDTDSSWVMQPNGSYRLRRTGQGRSVQHELLDQLASSGA